MKTLILSSIFSFAMSILAAGAGAQVIVIANPSVKASGVLPIRSYYDIKRLRSA